MRPRGGAGEALEHDRALAAPAQLPCRREAHDAAADDHDPHPPIPPPGAGTLI
jgi:hypothetical protein